MKITHCLGALAFALACQSAAFAREAPTPVKASVVLKTELSWDGKPIVYPEGKAEVTGLVVEVAPGAETGWHSHPVASFGYILEGELEVQLKNGAVKRLKAGEALAEVVNTLHNGRNLGLVPVKLVVFYIGAVGQALTVTEHVK
jgi:quercetin dioxygenase-like cupin family protein